MLHAKFQDHRTFGFGVDDFLRFYHIWARQPFWSCDLDHLHKLSFPFTRRLHIKFGFDGDREPIIAKISHESKSVGNSEAAIWQWMCLIG